MASVLNFLTLEWSADTAKKGILQQKTSRTTKKERRSPKRDYLKPGVASRATEKRDECKKTRPTEDKAINAGFLSKTERVGRKFKGEGKCKKNIRGVSRLQKL